MIAARVAVLFSAIFLALPAHAATVAVAPIRDAGKRGEGEAIEKQIEKGLSGGHIKVIGPKSLAAGAKKQGLPPGDIDKRPVLMPVARDAGADAVFTANLLDKGKQLQIRVFNLDGVELWSRKIPVAKGKLAADIPAKIAKAVNAALANAPAAEAPAETPAETPAQPEQQPAETQAEAPAQPEETPKPKVEPKSKQKPADSDQETAIVTPKRKPAKPADSDSSSASSDKDGEVSIEGPPQEAKADTQPQPPIIDVGLGFAMLSRTYRLCPGVSSCSQGNGPQPSGNLDTPVNYQTSSPAGGLILHLELFPLPKLVKISDTLTFTIGVSAEYLRSLGVTNQFQRADGTTGTFTSNSSRLTADVDGRLYFRALDGTGYVGLRGGALLPAFNADTVAQGDVPVLYPSQRKGFDLGLRASMPLAGNYVKVMAEGDLAPAANPGVEETTAYGQTGTGKGMLFRGGLEGEYSYVGYGAYADYAQFSDVFAGAGDRTTNGAVSEEKYLTFFVMIRGRY